MSSELELIVKENEKLKKENKYLKRLLEENDIHYVEIREVVYCDEWQNSCGCNR